MLNSSGCVVPWIMSNETICTNQGLYFSKEMHYIFIQLLPHYPVLLDAIKSTFWIAYNRVTNQFNDCHKTCRDLKIILGGGNIKVRKCMISTRMFRNFYNFRRRTTRQPLHYTLSSGWLLVRSIYFTPASHL